MNSSKPEPDKCELYRFGPFEADLSRGELRKFTRRIRLERKPWLLLIFLLERPGEVASRMALRRALWGEDIFVDFEHGLNVAVKKLRGALCDSIDSPVYIETVVGEGYRFIAPVVIVAPKESGNVAVNQHLIAAPPILIVDGKTRAWNLPWIRVLLAAFGVFCVGLMIVTLGWRPRQARSPTDSRPARTQVHRFVYVMDYSSSAIVGFAVNPVTGTLSPLPTGPFKSGEHPYFATFFPDNQFLYVVNRGRADGLCGNGCNISGYAVDQISGGLVELPGSPYSAGSGAVAATGHPSGKFYVVNVISNDVYTYTRRPDGGLELNGPPVPVGTHPFWIAVSPSGRFLYVTNRDDATISAFSIGPTGSLYAIAGSPFASGLRPRTIRIHPSGRFAFVVNYGVNPYLSRDAACSGSYGNAHGKGCTISVFAINPNTGSLAEIKGSPFESDGINPIWSVTDAEGNYLFVTNTTSNNVSAFRINSTTGELRLVSGSPFPAGDGPNAAALDLSNEFLYVLNTYSRNITSFAINTANGQLSPIGAPLRVAGLGLASISAQQSRIP